MKREHVKVGMVVKYQSDRVHYVKVASKPDKEDMVLLDCSPDGWAYVFELLPLNKRERGER